MKVSSGCAHCYAESLVKNRMGKELWGPNSERRLTTPSYWRAPRTWNKNAEFESRIRRVFCGSLMDVFEDHVTANGARPLLWNLINDTPYLHWQLLTKRPENIRSMLPRDWSSGYRNVWLGTSIESRKYCDRAASLISVPARVHFLSLEPLLEDVSEVLDLKHIEWVIVGGESGPEFRPMDLQWARNILELTRARKVPFFFKQSAARMNETGTLLDGESYKEFPLGRRI